MAGTGRLTVSKVSTHSRAKAAAKGAILDLIRDDVSTHSRAKAAANGSTLTDLD